MNDIIALDPTFSESAFKADVDNIFVQLHLAVMMGNIDRVRHFLAPDVFNDYAQLIDRLNRQHLTQMYDELNVKSTEILSATVLEDKMQIKVLLTSRYMDYKIDKMTGTLKEGNNTGRVEKQNYLTFEKRKDAKIQGIARKCPTCGANMNINESGQCKYCRTIYNLEKYDWILTEIVTKG